MPILLKLFQKNEKEATLPNSFYKASITDTKTRWGHHQKRNYMLTSLRNTDAKIFNKVSANWIQQYIKRIIHRDQLGLIPEMQGWFNISKSINMLHYINKMKDKNHMILSIDAEKASDKIQHPFRIKTLNKVGIEGTYLNVIKTTYDKPTATSYSTVRSWKHFLSHQDKTRMPLLPFLFNTLLEALARAILSASASSSVMGGSATPPLEGCQGSQVRQWTWSA